MVTPLGPQHDHAAYHQCRSDGDRIEQVLMNQVGKTHSENHRREESNQQVASKPLGLALFRQADHHFEDLVAVFPNHRENGSQLDDDIEGHRPLAAKIDEIGDYDLMTRTGDRQKLRDALDNAQNQCLHGRPKIHQSSYSARCVPHERHQ
ncbi:hypothetical protein FQZ97_966030 [compost metagenome]